MAAHITQPSLLCREKHIIKWKAAQCTCNHTPLTTAGELLHPSHHCTVVEIVGSPPSYKSSPELLIKIHRTSEVMHLSIIFDTISLIWYKRWHLGATSKSQLDFPQPLIVMQHIMHLALIFLAGNNNISYETCRLLPNSQILAAKPMEGADRAGKMRSNLMQVFCSAPQAPWLGMSKNLSAPSG